MPPVGNIDDLRRKLTHAEAAIAELRAEVTDLRRQIDDQQAHIHRLVRITFGRGGERVEGPTLFDGMDPPEAEVPTPVEPPTPERLPRRSGRATDGGASRRTCRVGRT